MGGSASSQVFLLRTSCVGGAQNNNKGHSAHLEGHLSARVRLIAQGGSKRDRIEGVSLNHELIIIRK